MPAIWPQGLQCPKDIDTNPIRMGAAEMGTISEARLVLALEMEIYLYGIINREKGHPR